MKSISIFNNKGGVGKTTLSFHLAHALSSLGRKVLMIDADPQCNLTLYCLSQEEIIEVWDGEDEFVANYQKAAIKHGADHVEAMLGSPRSLHFYLKPAQDGIEPVSSVTGSPITIRDNLHLIPGRLTFHEFEEELVFNWQGLFSQKPISIRLATGIRSLAEKFNEKYGYDYVIIDTSPSLGRLNRLLISTSDIFLIPCTPDLFSLYGIKNIGAAIRSWKEEYHKLTLMLDDENISRFPAEPARFAGYVIVNARKRSDSANEWKLSKAAFRYASKIPEFIRENIPGEAEPSFIDGEPIGGVSIMHSHAGMPSVSQQHHVPMWEVPEKTTPQDDDYYSVMGSRMAYEATKKKYENFALDLEERISSIF